MQTRTTRKLLSNIAAWLVLTLATALMAASSFDWLVYYHLVKRGVTTQGQVLGKEPDKHRDVHYSYTVAQQIYSETGGAGHGNPEFEQLQIGDKVLVFYDPQAPEKSFLGNPDYQLAAATRGVVFFTLLVPLLLIITFRLAGVKLG